MLVQINTGRSQKTDGIVNIAEANGQQRISQAGSAGKLQVFFSGVLFNVNSLKQLLAQQGDDDPNDSPAEVVAGIYRIFGEDGFKKLNGGFVFLLSDPESGSVLAVRDQLGLEPLYYYHNKQSLFVSDSLNDLVELADVPRTLNPTALYRYLVFNYVPGEDALFNDVFKLRPGHLLIFQGTEIHVRPYWSLSFANVLQDSEETIREQLLEAMKKAVRLRIDSSPEPLGMFLSGGMDSSSVLGLMRPMTDQTIHSYSFRCKGKSFDESRYAQIMSETYSTEHHLVEYGAGHVSLIEEMVGSMDEPFCDIGIEIATYLLARENGGTTRTILTGDGGDELFAGHPVYLADGAASRFDQLPGLIKNPVTALCQLIPDPEAKKNIWVKAKRFAYSVQFPAELYSNRWRLYYTPAEIARLTDPSLGETLSSLNPLDSIAALYDEADGQNFLSRTLYGDYHTVVDFYLRRMSLLRAFGIEGRYPLLDPNLVTFAASIPANLKIRDGKDTKYIQHATMADILPDEIVFRTDKLGHSVPFKNWMRGSREVQTLIQDVLSESTVRRRGLFVYPFIRKLIEQHQRRSHNHSHRIWALVVLELWMQKHQIK